MKLIKKQKRENKVYFEWLEEEEFVYCSIMSKRISSTGSQRHSMVKKFTNMLSWDWYTDSSPWTLMWQPLNSLGASLGQASRKPFRNISKWSLKQWFRSFKDSRKWLTKVMWSQATMNHWIEIERISALFIASSWVKVIFSLSHTKRIDPPDPDRLRPSATPFRSRCWAVAERCSISIAFFHPLLPLHCFVARDNVEWWAPAKPEYSHHSATSSHHLRSRRPWASLSPESETK